MLYIFDLDGTLIESNPNGPKDKVIFLPNVIKKCTKLHKAGHKLAIATNQGGCAFGHTTPDKVVEKLLEVAQYIPIAHWAWCPHHPQGTNSYAYECLCRKPEPGMIYECALELGYNSRRNITMVGDMNSDFLAAQKAGIHFEWTNEFFKEV